MTYEESILSVSSLIRKEKENERYSSAIVSFGCILIDVAFKFVVG